MLRRTAFPERLIAFSFNGLVELAPLPLHQILKGAPDRGLRLWVAQDRKSQEDAFQRAAAGEGTDWAGPQKRHDLVRDRQTGARVAQLPEPLLRRTSARHQADHRRVMRGAAGVYHHAQANGGEPDNHHVRLVDDAVNFLCIDPKIVIQMVLCHFSRTCHKCGAAPLVITNNAIYIVLGRVGRVNNRQRLPESLEFQKFIHRKPGLPDDGCYGALREIARVPRNCRSCSGHPTSPDLVASFGLAVKSESRSLQLADYIVSAKARKGSH